MVTVDRVITETLLRGEIDPEAPLLVVATAEEAEHLQTDLPVLLTGIGRLRTAESLAFALAGATPSRIINVGTAGALVDGVSGVHRIASVSLHDFSHSAVRRLTGETAYPELSLYDVQGGQPGHDEPALRLATGDVFVDDPRTRARLAEHADLVDMEGYAIAWIARRRGIPVDLVKLVSDSADDGAGKLWINGVEECSRILGRWLLEYK